MEKDEGIENFRAAIMIIQCDSHPYAAIAAPQIMWLLAVVLLCAGICSGQGRSALSPSVRELVAVDAAVVVLQHVRVVDGTGAPFARATEMHRSACLRICRRLYTCSGSRRFAWPGSRHASIKARAPTGGQSGGRGILDLDMQGCGG